VDRERRSPGSTGISSGRKKIHDPLARHQINLPASVGAGAGKKIHQEEGRRDFSEEIQEDLRRRRPHFQTASFTPFSDRRSH
jgi:hypothetical protein